MKLETAQKFVVEADRNFRAAEAECEILRTRLNTLQKDLTDEKVQLKLAEQEAVSARAAGKSVKTQALDNMRGNVRITEDALSAVECQLGAASREASNSENSLKAAMDRLERLKEGLLYIECIPVLVEIFRRLHQGGRRLGTLQHTVRIVGSLESDVDGCEVRLLQNALDMTYGTASADRQEFGAAMPSMTRMVSPDLLSSLPKFGAPSEALRNLTQRVHQKSHTAVE